MKFVILRGKFSNKFFGVQLICGRYTVQWAFWKFGIYNDKAHKWWPYDYRKKNILQEEEQRNGTL